jgi:hypothetical protein
MTHFFEELKFRNEPLYYFGSICLVAAVICLLLIWLKPIQVLGTSAWYKPFKFFLSTTIFVWSMAWYAHHLGNSSAVLLYSWGLIVLFTLEDVYIVVQAARGLTSHFNVSNSFYSGMWALMAFAAVTISVWTFIVSFPFFIRNFPELPLAYVWGIRFGLIVFFIFSLEGLAMGARLAHTVGTTDGSPGLPVVNWSKAHGDLRVAHFLGMHALQLLPLLGFFVLRNAFTISVVSVLYLLICVFTFAQALAGKPFLRF